jgi:hypothetical protein
MLINNSKFDKGDVVVFKMVNGDEIVTEIIEDAASDYRVKKPQTVVPSAKGMGLMPALFTAKDDHIITVAKAHVMMAAPAVEEMVRHYNQTTTGIMTLSKGSIIT